MKTPLTIPVGPPAGPGLDFVALLADGIALTQELSSDIWTDYNEHDPGVTILEQLCYALTGLAYRAGFSVASLLVGPAAREVDLPGQSLYPARAIFPCSPVTLDDYRKLIIDRLPWVRNVWLTPVPAAAAHGVLGLYEIAIYAPESDPCACDGPSPEQLRHEVLRLFCRHRALCEDVQRAYVLMPLPATVTATVTLEGTQDSAIILAQMLFAVGMLFGPEPARRSLDELLAAGVAPAAIFEGPLLRHGFIADTELAPRQNSIRLADILRAMAAVPGVVAVTALSVTVGLEQKIYRDNATIPVPPETYLALTNALPGGTDPITLWRNGVPCQPEAARVRRQLDRLWTAQRRRYRLAAEYPRHFPVPRAAWDVPAAYFSIQNQFPNTYGISEFGLPAGAGPLRQGQARQLKAYLLVFEQLLADYFSQLAEVRNLYAARHAHGPTYFFQSLQASVPLVAPLLAPDYLAGLAAVVASQDPAADRRNRFLSFLLALYAQSLTAPPAAFCDCVPGAGPDLTPLIEAKCELLHRLVPATRDRGRGFDYRAPPGRHGQAGLEIKASIELALGQADADDAEAELGSIVEGPEEARYGQRLSTAMSAQVDRLFTVIDPAMVPAPAAAPFAVFAGQTVAAGLLRAAGDMANFRVGVLAQDRMASLVCKAPEDDVYWLIGRFASLEACLAELARFARDAARLRAAARRLYIIEHVLLRDAQAAIPPPAGVFAYGFTVSAVLPAALLGEGASEGLRQDIAAVLRRNAPALVVVQICFLSHRRMRRFRALRRRWQAALRGDDPFERAASCAHLQRFLMRPEHAEDPAA
jgi:hypothetical protein